MSYSEFPTTLQAPFLCGRLDTLLGVHFELKYAFYDRYGAEQV